MIYEIIIIAICSYVYVNILTEQGMILGWWYDLLKKLPEWLFNPLVGCIYCVTGQVALWYYLFTYWNEYNLLTHIVYICLSIFAVEIIMIIKTKTQ